MTKNVRFSSLRQDMQLRYNRQHRENKRARDFARLRRDSNCLRHWRVCSGITGDGTHHCKNWMRIMRQRYHIATKSHYNQPPGNQPSRTDVRRSFFPPVAALEDQG